MFASLGFSVNLKFSFQITPAGKAGLVSWDSEALRKPATAYALTLCAISTDKLVRQLLTLIFLILVTVDSFGQYKGVSDFYDKMFEIEMFREFNSKHAVPMKDFRTRHDTTRVNNTYILNFDKHPNLDKSSGGGRLERFNSIYADSTSVYEVSDRLYISFKKIAEGELFVDSLLSRLKKVIWKPVQRKTETFDEYIVYGKEMLDSNGNPKTSISTTYPCIIKLRLIPIKGTGECELYIGL
ncbi:hypothetical protein BH09BAC3_BH09BAC3_25770 [soil metagenome]